MKTVQGIRMFPVVLCFLMFGAILCAAPEVSNVQASQRMDGSMVVDISYDLGGADDGVMVIFEVSPDGGATWRMPGQNVAGDIGPGIISGENFQITWNPGEVVPDEYWLNCLVRISTRDMLTIMLPGNIPMEFVKISAGTFIMGSPETERSRLDWEGPQTYVTLTEDYYMGIYPVTQAQWLAIKGDWPNDPPEYGSLGDNKPAFNINWDDTQDFLTFLNFHINSTEQAEITVDLPTEAQWEYACRAGTTTRFFFGDSLSVDDEDTDGPTDSIEYPGKRSDYMLFTSYPGTHRPSPRAVGTRLPNAFGLYDMHGNISEWVKDAFIPELPGGSVTDPLSEGGSPYVVRGGNWDTNARFCRSAYRTGALGEGDSDKIGFRIIATMQK